MKNTKNVYEFPTSNETPSKLGNQVIDKMGTIAS